MATELIPFNPNKVLQKITRNIQAAENNEHEQAWSQAVIRHLENLKAPVGIQPKRGKKLYISLGKSVSAVDIIINQLPDGKGNVR